PDLARAFLRKAESEGLARKTVSKEALDILKKQDGKVARVDFYVVPMSFFADPILVGSDASAPYAVTLDKLGTGMWMVYAVAVDREGVQAQSIPVHITVLPKDGGGMDNMKH
ncbi:hypothetical protein CNY89_18230, partial [Amaricoccus sp. HAR-UPW-R2A-40]